MSWQDISTSQLFGQGAGVLKSQKYSISGYWLGVCVCVCVCVCRCVCVCVLRALV